MFEYFSTLSDLEGEYALYMRGRQHVWLPKKQIDRTLIGLTGIDVEFGIL